MGGSEWSPSLDVGSLELTWKAILRIFGGLPKLGAFSWGPYNSDHRILGSILGSPDFGQQPFGVHKTV